MADHPERIYHWLNSQLSIARFAGSITINGTTYIVATLLLGHDISKAINKKESQK